MAEPSGSVPSRLDLMVRELLARQAEGRNLDYKRAMLFGPAKPEKAKLLKDIMAMTNTQDGGYLLIGAHETRRGVVAEGLTPEQINSFDITKLGDFAREYCSSLPQLESSACVVDDNSVLLIRVAEFDSEPLVCTRDINDEKNRPILRRGSVYVRTPDARSVEIDSSEVMRSFLDLALQKRASGLLGQIRRLVGGGFEVDQPPLAAYETERAAALELFKREKIAVPHWSVEVMPTEYVAERVASIGDLRRIRQQSVVSLRGWDFPHIGGRSSEESVFESGIESITHWGAQGYNEAHRLYKSGLFSYRNQLHELSRSDYQEGISYISSIYSVLEFFEFANRYAPQVADQGTFHISLSLSGLRGRQLVMDNNGFRDTHTTGAQSFEREYTVPVEELRASYRELAIEATRRLFELFDLDVPDSAIREWQQRLIDGRF